MKLFTCTDHDGHWPVGVASIILDLTEELAREQLKRELAKRGLDPFKPFTLTEVPIDQADCIVLNDGDY
jgi:hypothetical protein